MNIKKLFSKLQNFIHYLKHRFPVVPLYLYTLITVLGISATTNSHNYFKVFSLSIIYLLFLFHLRVLDEFKDFSYDTKHHTDRPVQSGLITLRELQKVGFINSIMIAFLVFFTASLFVATFFGIAYLYTFLMFKEFFLGEKLKKRSVLYLLSHEVVFIPLFLYFYSALYEKVWIINSISDAALVLFTIIPIILIEIGRKIPHRYDKKGRKTNDTYSFQWGEVKTIQVFSALVVISGVLSLFITHFKQMLTMGIFAGGSALYVMSYIHHQIIVKYNMVITTIFALGLPLCLLL